MRVRPAVMLLALGAGALALYARRRPAERPALPAPAAGPSQPAIVAVVDDLLAAR
jgi:hypothetical protein